MSNDLISRSEVVKLLYRYADRKHANGEIELANGILKAKCFIEDIESVPVAYDPDKVVEQIYKEQEKQFIANEVPIGCIDCAEVIEMVRGGGVE